MFKSSMMVKLLVVIFIVLSACGGGGGELSFVPGDIAPEYEDLTLEQLKIKGKLPSYKDLTDNIDNYKGELVWFTGQVSRIMQGSKEGTYQIYVNVTHQTEAGGLKLDKWRDPMLILYKLDRGPEFNVGDMVQVSGIVQGILEAAGFTRGQDFGPTVYDRPVVSVIRADLVTVSE